MEIDAWLAECLWGEPLPLGPDDESYAMCFGGQPNQWNIGYASKTLKEAIEKLPPKQADEHRVYISLAGGRKQQVGCRHIVFNIARWDGETALDRAPRSWSEREDFRTYCIGAH